MGLPNYRETLDRKLKEKGITKCNVLLEDCPDASKADQETCECFPTCKVFLEYNNLPQPYKPKIL